MKKLVALLLLPLLAACTLFGPTSASDPNLTATREGTTVTFAAKVGPVLLIGASAAIKGFESDPAGACKYRPVTAGPTHAMECEAPATVKLLDFLGEARAVVVSRDGLRTFTAVVPAP
jgi:hypothetical protein